MTDSPLQKIGGMQETWANIDGNTASGPSRLWEWLRQRNHLPGVLREQGFLPLLLSAALGEVAANIVYVVLLERAYALGGETASVGGVLLVQSVPQVFLGIWAGNLVDRLGKRKGAIAATLASAALAVGLVAGQTILAVYILALLIMLARLALVPARLALVSHVSSKANLVTANTALVVVTALGLFLGPAISAALMLTTGGFLAPLLLAALGYMLSVPPLLRVPVATTDATAAENVSIGQEIRAGWQFISRHRPVWQVLMCLVYFSLVMGAITPLITPLAHDLGLGPEGTGIFFAAAGLGGLIGAPFVMLLAKRLSISAALLLAGLLTAVGTFFIGLTDNLEGALAGLLLTALAGASLNVIVLTVLQRLTPLNMQGRVFGIQQTLLGVAWVASLAMTTGVMANWPEEVDAQTLFSLVGGSGFLAFLAFWFWYRYQINSACQMCEPRPQVLGAVCQVICESRLQVSVAACRVICSSPVRCHY